jgi:hypothetical protein
MRVLPRLTLPRLLVMALLLLILLLLLPPAWLRVSLLAAAGRMTSDRTGVLMLSFVTLRPSFISTRDRARALLLRLT